MARTRKGPKTAHQLDNHTQPHIQENTETTGALQSSDGYEDLSRYADEDAAKAAGYRARDPWHVGID